MASVSRLELDIAIQNIDKLVAQFLFGEILITANVTVLREILKYISYDESFPSSMTC